MSEFEAVSKQIEEAKGKGWNLLIPSIPLTPVDGGMFVPALETVQISANPQDREVYPGSDKNSYRLHATALQRIAVAGGLKWMPELCGFVRSGDAIAYRAVGGVVKAEGDLYTEAGYYDQDPEILYQNLEEEYELKRSKYKGRDWWEKKSKTQRDEYIKACVNRDFRQKRAYRLQFCETGAKNRVIRKIFNVKSEYTAQELSKPFLILRYRIRLDYQDPVVRAAVVGGAIQAAFGVFGGGGQPRQIAAPEMGINPAEDTNLAGYADTNPSPEPTNMVADPDEPAANGEGQEPMDSALADFENADKEAQMDTLRLMAKRAGFESLGAAQKDERFKGLNRSQYFTTLRDMSQGKPPEDDIPF